MNNAPLPLWQQAADFALELMETLAGVLPTGDLGLELTAQVNNATYQLTTADPHGIELRGDDKPAFRFEIDYRLVTNTRGDWLKVQRSSFAVVPDGTGAPFFRYDFDVDARSVPRVPDLGDRRDSESVWRAVAVDLVARRRGAADRGWRADADMTGPQEAHLCTRS